MPIIYFEYINKTDTFPPGYEPTKQPKGVSMKSAKFTPQCLIKNLLTSVVIAISPLAVVAETLTTTQESIAPSSIDQEIRLVDKNDTGSSHKKVSIIVTDSGMSTDVSPRYTIYLGYASFAEMGNIAANFKVTDQAFKFLTASRKAPGIYEIKFVEYRADGVAGFYEVTQMIDATKMFADENKLRNSCGDDFCDHTLNTTISVSETLKKL